MRWDCPFSYIACILAAAYLFLFTIGLVYVIRILSSTRMFQRIAQKLFFLCVQLMTTVRLLYLILWPLLDGSCSPGVANSEGRAFDFLGNFPSILFVGAYSITVLTFARVYHKATNDFRKFELVGAFFLALNLAALITFILDTSLPGFGLLRLYAFEACCFFLAVVFVWYGAMLYLLAKQRIQGARPELSSDPLVGQPPDSDDAIAYRQLMAQPDLEQSSSSSSSALDLYLDRPKPRNPMKKLVVVSVLCMVSFLLRVAFLLILSLVLDESSLSYLILGIYLIVTEVVPVSLMLYIFDTAGQSVGKHGADGFDQKLPGDDVSEAGSQWDASVQSPEKPSPRSSRFAVSKVISSSSNSSNSSSNSGIASADGGAGAGARPYGLSGRALASSSFSSSSSSRTLPIRGGPSLTGPSSRPLGVGVGVGGGIGQGHGHGHASAIGGGGSSGAVAPSTGTGTGAATGTGAGGGSDEFWSYASPRSPSISITRHMVERLASPKASPRSFE